MILSGVGENIYMRCLPLDDIDASTVSGLKAVAEQLNTISKSEMILCEIDPVDDF
jgi:hypothetical protein